VSENKPADGQAITQVDSVTQQNAALVEQADELAKAAEVFRVEVAFLV